jgi:hypothetical protein
MLDLPEGNVPTDAWPFDQLLDKNLPTGAGQIMFRAVFILVGPTISK